MKPQAKKPDAAKIRELSEAAKALLDDKAFAAALLTLRQTWFGELMDERLESAKQSELCAKLRALDQFASLLGNLREEYARSVKMKVVDG